MATARARGRARVAAGCVRLKGCGGLQRRGGGRWVRAALWAAPVKERRRRAGEGGIGLSAPVLNGGGGGLLKGGWEHHREA